MGQYVQLIKKDNAFDFLKIQQDNFSNVDALIYENKLNKFIFSNYLFEKFIINANEIGIRIASIDFYDELSHELRGAINETIELRNHQELLNLIKDNDLDIKYLEFIDSNKKMNRIFSNGIIWKEKSSRILEILSQILR